jgi:hypothetical protein
MKAALEAWGANSNLFHQSAAAVPLQRSKKSPSAQKIAAQGRDRGGKRMRAAKNRNGESPGGV